MLENIAYIRAFVQVVDSGGISHAARVLGMPPNTVGRMIQKLEEQAGASLLARSTRRMAVTEEGRRFYQNALGILEAIHIAEENIHPRQKELSGSIRVAVRTTTVQFGIVHDLCRFLSENKYVRIQLFVTDEPPDFVSNGLDLALRIGAVQDSNLKIVSLGSVHFGLAASPGFVQKYGRPKAPGDLKSFPCILASSKRPQTFWSLVDGHGKKQDAPVSGPFECNDVRAQADAIYSGLGIGLRPMGEIRGAVEKGTLVPILPHWRLQAIPVSLLKSSRRQGGRREKLIQPVIEMLVEAVKRMN